MGSCALSRLAELCYLLMRKYHHHHEPCDLVPGQLLHDSIHLKTSPIDRHDCESRLPSDI